MCRVVSWKPFYMGIRNKWFVSGAARTAQTCWSYQLSNLLKIIGYIWIKYTVALKIRRFSKLFWIFNQLYIANFGNRAAEQAANKTRAGKITVENVMLPPDWAHFRHHRKFFCTVSLMVLHCTMRLRHMGWDQSCYTTSDHSTNSAKGTMELAVDANNHANNTFLTRKNG